MKTAIIKPSLGTDRLRFEVHSTPSRGHQSVQKWYMKANHPVEASRWTQAINKSIEWYKRDASPTTDSEGRRKSAESDSSGLRSTHSTHSQTPAHTQGRFSGTLLRKGRNVFSDQGSASSSKADLSGNVSSGGGEPPNAEDASPSLHQIGDANADGDGDGDDEEAADDSSGAESTSRNPPHSAGFELHGNSTAAQMELTAQLLSNIVLPPDAGARARELNTAVKESFAVVQGMLNEYVQMVREREEWWTRRLEKEKRRQKFWEESLATVVKEGESLEQELRVRSRRRGSRFFDAGVSVSEGMGTLKNRPSILGAPAASTVFEEKAPADYFPIQSPEPMLPAEAEVRRTPTRSETQDTITKGSTTGAVTTPVPVSTPTNVLARMTTKYADEGDEADTDDEDEFFDAIESGTLPNLIVPDALTNPKHDLKALPFNIEQYAGYSNLRITLNLNHERPSTSLWSVLKHSIGKDLTKISFPVFFNEPTSMLQRMVGYSYLL
jgi:hypothetical protein